MTALSPLGGLRVLELPGQEHAYCGRLLADLGADVVKVEPPSGDPARHAPPFADAEIARMRSLPFAFLNANKRGIVLDIDRDDQRDLLVRLVGRADVLLDGYPPGFLAARGLDPGDLASRYPALILTSVTPFGQDGPYARNRVDDLACLAQGGLMYLAGEPSGPPLRVYGNQSHMISSLHAAVATLLALVERQSSRLGQVIDVSMQECVANATENAVQFFDLEGIVRRRTGLERIDAATGVFPCADGEIYLISSLQGALLGWDAVPAWLRGEGAAGARALEGPEWRDTEWRKTAEAKAVFDGVFNPFCAARTKAALYRSGQAAGVNVCPINSPLDVCADPHLAARGFITTLSLPEGGTVPFPRFPYLLSESPAAIRRPPPLLGEHTREVCDEWLGSGAEGSPASLSGAPA